MSEQKRPLELKLGDLVDLEGDPYADTSEDWKHYHECEYGVVEGVEQETSDCVRVDFEHLSVGFPLDHLLTVDGNDGVVREIF